MVVFSVTLDWPKTWAQAANANGWSGATFEIWNASTTGGAWDHYGDSTGCKRTSHTPHYSLATCSSHVLCRYSMGG